MILNRTADKHSLMYDYRAVAAAGGGLKWMSFVAVAIAARC